LRSKYCAPASLGDDSQKLIFKFCVSSKPFFKVKTKSGNHPTEKPKDLYEWLLSRYCPKDGLVLDPTAGSFNSIIVARELGIRGIGIEKDDKFFWTAVNKIK